MKEKEEEEYHDDDGDCPNGSYLSFRFCIVVDFILVISPVVDLSRHPSLFLLSLFLPPSPPPSTPPPSP